jgi:hypothetical protein
MVRRQRAIELRAPVGTVAGVVGSAAGVRGRRRRGSRAWTEYRRGDGLRRTSELRHGGPFVSVRRSVSLGCP